MIQTSYDPRAKTASSGMFCVLDAEGRPIGTIRFPVQRQPLGHGREKVYLERPAAQPDRPAR
ncbi:MAG: hypothetical protein IT356_05050 [Gemmatimonadaceae bacterium]|nr:hypothetical protein [Gemmatimonadaceae bacterium]